MSFFKALDKVVNKIPEGIGHARATAIGVFYCGYLHHARIFWGRNITLTFLYSFIYMNTGLIFSTYRVTQP